MPRLNLAFLPALLLVLAHPTFALAVIKNLIPLRSVLSSEEMIFEATVEKIDASKPAVYFKAGPSLKGKIPFTRMPVNMTGDAEAKREKHTEQILKRLAPELTVIMFVSKRGPRHLAFVYSNGTWFQMEGRGESDDQLKWSFLHGEPYLRRTFNGTTEALKKAIADGLAGKPVPPVDEKAEPGFGPEAPPAPKKDAEKPLATRGPALPLAVAPTFLLIAPLALLATLFPATFGGLALVLKRWMTALSILCTISTLYFLHAFFANRLDGTLVASPLALWLVMGVIAMFGAVWSARRYRAALEQGEHEAYQPRRWDRWLLILTAVTGVVLVAVAIQQHRSLIRYPWLDLVAFSVPVWAAAVAAIPGREAHVPIVSVETVFLWGLVFACGGVVALEVGKNAAATSSAIQLATTEHGPRPVGKIWEQKPPGDGSAFPTPLIDGNRIYVACAQAAGLSQAGAVFALNADTGGVEWMFNDDQQMKPAFCSPVLAAGRIYIGEGFHENQDCKLYCLSAADGKKLWEFPTQSHTESTPCVVEGRVYFGAGDDGIYCIDGVNGRKIWNYPGVHVDSKPVVLGGRLFVGTGVGDLHKTTLLLCLDAASGKEIWKIPVELPAFAPPAAAGGRVFFGIGNGTMTESHANPRGAVLCVEAATGKRLWQADARDAVLCEPAVDGDSVYFTSRDGYVYCIRRPDGTTRWKRSLGAPIVASPTLVGDDGDFGAVRSLYVAGTNGRVECLNVENGEPYWSMDLTKVSRFATASVNAAPIVSVRRDAGIERRRIIIAAQLANDLGLSTLVRWYCFEDEVK